MAFKIKHIDPNYWLEANDLQRTDTGLLAMFFLTPQDSSQPTFRARIDDGSPDRRKEPEVDIDIFGASRALEDDFKAGRQGNSGHHSIQNANSDRRVFWVCIKIDNKPIFDAEVSFNLAFLSGISEVACAEDHMDGSVSRDDGAT